ncbi:MAG: hypothetical protein Q9Q13_09495 [Acidobacteriota bacterium]|nr:hypothetical protein [Acidobacteriota bacterium]
MGPPGSKVFRSPEGLDLRLGGRLAAFELVYETWGRLTPSADNALLLCCGLSASSHAASTPSHPEPGWWEPMIGPGKAIDTDRYFVICSNVLGGASAAPAPRRRILPRVAPGPPTFP